MQAPEDRTLEDKKAVNQYDVVYDGINLAGEYENTYTLPSNETYIEFRDLMGSGILQKVDADHVKKDDGSGNVTYANITGAKVMVYDSEQQPLWEEARETSEMGRILLENVKAGTYTTGRKQKLLRAISRPRGYMSSL